MRSYQQCGKRVTLARDKLYVNIRLYDLKTTAFVHRPLQPSQQQPSFNTRNQTAKGTLRRVSREGRPLVTATPEYATRTPARLNFVTPNRFFALSDPEKTSLKRKERSPTDSTKETETKRIDTTDSPTESRKLRTTYAVRKYAGWDPHAWG